MSSSTNEVRQARRLVTPYFEAMLTQQTVWGRIFTWADGSYERVATEEWFPAVITEIRRPNEYGLTEGCICVHRTDGLEPSTTYIFLPLEDHLALEDPTSC